ncbi:MAG TPA: hypothetical protein VHL11_24970 [Phototrophicaceae bacterium]|jgi:hypothetical protein|nr:hypothetical protein [Phototrophicaceae bacterium]
MADNTVTTAARALMDALQFTEADLQANRAGKLSDTQRQALAQRTVLMGGLALIGVIVFALTYNSLPDAGGQGSSLVNFALMPIALAVIAFAGIEVFGAFMKLQRGTLTSVRGTAEIEIDVSPRRMFGKLTVGKFTMHIPKTQLVAFHQGDTYAIYFTPYPKQIMSAEFISENR